MPYLTVRGIPHYYQWVSEIGERPTGKPVMLFIHGWGGSGRYWESTAAALSQDLDGLIYDLRGFGRSPLPSPSPATTDLATAITAYALETYAEDLATLLDHLGIEQVYLNAHSMGASIAVLFLQRWGDRCPQAILNCSGIFEYDARAFATFYQFGRYVVTWRPRWLTRIPLAHRLFMARFLHQSLPAKESQAFLADFVAADAPAALGTLYDAVSLKAAETLPLAFTSLKMPTLLLSGQFDQIIPPALGLAAANLNSCIEHDMVPATGHFPMLEAPEYYRQRIQTFLA